MEETYHDSKSLLHEAYIKYFDNEIGKDEYAEMFDPSHQMPSKDLYGSTIPLTLDCSRLFRNAPLYDFFTGLSDEDLFENNIGFD